jgi:uncharacterized membrane protein YqjE
MEGIKDTIFKLLRIDNLVDNISGYVDARVKLLKIEIKEDVARILSKGLVSGSMIVIALIFLFFISIGFAQFLNTYFENSFEGYLIVAGIYLVVLVVFLIFKKSIDKKLERYFSDKIKQIKD